MSRGAVSTAALLMLLLSGCSGNSDPKDADFRSVRATQAGADQGFQLVVHVRGLGDLPPTLPQPGENLEGAGPGPFGDETVPIPGAFVGALVDGQPVAKGTADAQGNLTLVLKPQQRVRLVARAEGWTQEDSRPLVLGGGAAMPNCVPLPTGCLATRTRDDAELQLTDDQAFVTMLLVRPTLHLNTSITVAPHVHVDPVALPDAELWEPLPPAWTLRPDLGVLFAERLVGVNASLRWTNDALHHADLELVLGCDNATFGHKTQGDATENHLLEVGDVALTLAWTPPVADGWTACEFHAGPLIDTATTSMTTRVELDLAFEAKSTIQIQDG